MQDYIISNESDAIRFLEQYLDDPDSIAILNVKIESWSNFTIHLTGEKFHNSITPSVMKGVIELQHSLYQAFALAVHGQSNTSLLTKEQKKQLEIVVVVKDGSSILDFDINEMLKSLIETTAGKMSSTQVLVLILFTVVVYFGTSAWRSWLEKRNEKAETETDADVQKQVIESLSKTNERAIAVLEKFAEQNTKAQDIYEKSAQAKNQVVRATHYAQEIDLDGLATLTGEQAEYLTRQPRHDWETVRLDGRYRMLRVNSSSTLERKVTIRNLESNREFTATLEDTTLEKRHLEQLSIAEWNHHPLQLKIKAKMKHGNLKDAIIISVEKVETDIVFDDSKEATEKD